MSEQYIFAVKRRTYLNSMYLPEREAGNIVIEEYACIIK